MPTSLASSIPKMVGHTTSGNGHPLHTPLGTPSSHFQMRRHHSQGNTSCAHTWPLWGHLHQQMSFTYREITSMREKKTKTQVTKQQKLLLNLLSLFWPSFTCLTGLLEMCNDHLESASLGAHPPLVVYLHLTTATHSASCYTKHKNKQIIQ